MESQRNRRSPVSKVGSKLTRLSSSSVANISSLGEELLIEIFSRLGPESKHAFRCKSVSKLWLSILSSSCFIRRWRKMNQNEEDKLPSIILTQSVHSMRNYRQVFDNCALNIPNLKGLCTFESFDFIGKENIYILATCRDLVLCCSKENDYNAYYLCNPFTKQWIVLPPPPPTGIPNGVAHSVQVGIMAYDDDEDDDCSFNFKILRIIPQMYEDVWKVEIFYSGDISGGWRLIDNVDGWTDTFWSCCKFGGCVPYNGMLVWLIRSGEVEPVVAKLVGFKLNPSIDASLNCTLLPTPPEFVTDYISSIIGLFRGRLRLAQWVDIDPFQYDENELANPDLVLRIWQLNSDWELLHEMNFRELEDSTEYSIVRSCLLDGYSRLMSSILAFDPQDGDILYLSFAILKRSPRVEGSFFIFMCNVKQRTLKPIRKLPFTPYPCSSLRLLVPSWPTSVPLLPSV